MFSQTREQADYSYRAVAGGLVPPGAGGVVVRVAGPVVVFGAGVPGAGVVVPVGAGAPLLDVLSYNAMMSCVISMPLEA